VKGLRLAAGPLLFLAASFLPWAPGMEPAARRTAGVAAWMAVWWITEAVPIPVTALLPLALFPALGILSSPDTAAHYGNHLVFLFLGGFLLALALEEWNLHRRIALRVVTAIGGGPRRLVFGFMAATAALSLGISNTATVLLMLPIAVAVVHRLSEHAELDGAPAPERAASSLGVVLMLSIAYAASIGGLGTLIGTPTNIVFAGVVRRLFPHAPEVGFVSWMVFAIPLVLVFLPAAWFVVQAVAPAVPLRRFRFPDALNHLREERRRLGPPSGGERIVAWAFAATAALWITRAPVQLGSVRLPGWSTLFPRPEFIHDAPVVMATCLPLFMIVAADAAGNRRPILTWAAVERKAPWGILLLFGGGFALAAGFESSGLARWIGERLAGLGALPLPVLVFVLCLGVSFLTEVTSNTATATLLLPILAAAATGMGVHPFLLMIPATLSASCAFMLPVATPPNAIVFGSPWVTIPRMARTGLLLNLIGAVLITLFALGPMRVVFDMNRNGEPDWALPGASTSGVPE